MKTIVDTQNDKSVFRQTESNDGITKTLEVKEVENGYIIKVCEYGYKKTGKDKEEYIDSEKLYISKENPLAEEPKSLKEQINDALNNLP